MRAKSKLFGKLNNYSTKAGEAQPDSLAMRPSVLCRHGISESDVLRDLTPLLKCGWTFPKHIQTEQLASIHN